MYVTHRVYVFTLPGFNKCWHKPSLIDHVENKCLCRIDLYVNVPVHIKSLQIFKLDIIMKKNKITFNNCFNKFSLWVF